MTFSDTIKYQKDFSSELFSVHLEEASFLYEHRLNLIDDPEITWKDLVEFEDRFEAHIDALVAGEDLALEACHERAQEGDYGELHAAVRVFCRQNKGDLVAEAWRRLDAEDTERTKAISDALKDECPDEWQDSLTPIFLRDYFDLIPLMAPVFGYRRYNAEPALLHALNKAPDNILPPVIWALGRIGGQAARDALFPLLNHPDDTVRKATAESLLRLGEYAVVSRSLSNAPFDNWSVTALGLGGGRDAFNVLLDRIKHGNVDDDSLIALGLLGNLSALKVLYSFIENEDLARSATTGLYLITGAEIYEEVYVPDEIDEDELFEEELEAYRNEGKEPTKSDGEPFGETIRRLTQNPQDWKNWFSKNKSCFNPNFRYRRGKPYSPASLLETIMCEASPYRARQLAIEELKVRYDADFPIEVNMPVVTQIEILTRIAKWVQSNEARFQPGKWYLAGRPIQD